MLDRMGGGRGGMHDDDAGRPIVQHVSVCVYSRSLALRRWMGWERERERESGL